MTKLTKKILNPANFYKQDYLLSLPIKTIKGRQLRVLTQDERVKVTSCQCYHDCECNGSMIGEIIDYYRLVEHDNTNRAFYADPNYLPHEQRKN